ncbi:MAG: flagellar hook-length control protein FliK [Planctomycetota bacterium]
MTTIQTTERPQATKNDGLTSLMRVSGGTSESFSRVLQRQRPGGEGGALDAAFGELDAERRPAVREAEERIAKDATASREGGDSSDGIAVDSAKTGAEVGAETGAQTGLERAGERRDGTRSDPGSARPSPQQDQNAGRPESGSESRAAERDASARTQPPAPAGDRSETGAAAERPQAPAIQAGAAPASTKAAGASAPAQGDGGGAAKVSGPALGLRGFRAEAPGVRGEAKPEQLLKQERPEPQRVLGQVTRGLATLLKKGGGDVSLRLNPDSLGAVRVDVSMRDGRITASMRAETDSARQLLTGNLDDLRRSLERRGLVVDRIVVEPGEDRSAAAASRGSAGRESGEPPDRGTTDDGRARWSGPGDERERHGDGGRERSRASGGDPRAVNDRPTDGAGDSNDRDGAEDPSTLGELDGDAVSVRLNAVA